MSGRIRRELPRLGALAIVTVIIWCVVYGRYSPASLATPLVYTGGDELWVHAVVKAVADGEIGLLGSRHVRRLGAPFIANWNDFPLTEDLIFYATGQVAKLCGVHAAVNLGYIAAIMLAACSFYAVGRYMRWAWLWCFAGAVLYGWSYYMAVRSIAHFNLIFYWTIPLWLLICWWTAARPGIPFHSRRFWFSAVVIVFTAWNNPYYTNLFLQLFVLAIVARVIRGFPKSSLAAPVTLAVAGVLLALTANLDTILYQARHGLNGGAALRYLAELELYSLRPVDLFLPFYHRFPGVEAFTHSYDARTILRGEMMATYLGIFACLAVLHLWGSTLRKFLGRARQRIDGLSLQTLWILLFCACGSLSMIPGLLDIVVFRAMNRGSIVILTLALLHGVRVASRATRRWPPFAMAAAAAVVVLIGLWDQTPARRSDPREEQALAARVAGDRAFIARLEERLPHGAQVFQLPTMRSQEAQGIHQMSPYAAFRPYVVSRSLHFSHGDDFGRATHEWRTRLAALPVPQIIEVLERHGFHGVLIDRTAHPDGGAAELQAFAEHGKQFDHEATHESFVFIPLTPAATPERATLPAFCTRGWYPPEGDATEQWQWTAGRSTVELRRPPGDTPQTKLSFALDSPDVRNVEIWKLGKVARRVALDVPSTLRRVNLTVEWPPGCEKITLDFRTDAPPRIPRGDRRAIAFRLSGLTQTPDPFLAEAGPQRAE